MELPKEVRELVTYSAQNWPKKLDSVGLLRELDALARRIYVFVESQHEAKEKKGDS